MGYFHKIGVIIFLLACYSGGCNSLKSQGSHECTHGGILRGVSLQGGTKKHNTTLLGRDITMEQCIKKCCDRGSCDLVLLAGNDCQGVQCGDQNSCQIVHVNQATMKSQIAFITKAHDYNRDHSKEKTARIQKASMTHKLLKEDKPASKSTSNKLTSGHVKGNESHLVASHIGGSDQGRSPVLMTENGQVSENSLSVKKAGIPIPDVRELAPELGILSKDPDDDEVEEDTPVDFMGSTLENSKPSSAVRKTAISLAVDHGSHPELLPKPRSDRDGSAIVEDFMKDVSKTSALDKSPLSVRELIQSRVGDLGMNKDHLSNGLGGESLFQSAFGSLDSSSGLGDSLAQPGSGNEGKVKLIEELIRKKPDDSEGVSKASKPVKSESHKDVKTSKAITKTTNSKKHTKGQGRAKAKTQTILQGKTLTGKAKTDVKTSTKEMIENGTLVNASYPEALANLLPIPMLQVSTNGNKAAKDYEQAEQKNLSIADFVNKKQDNGDPRSSNLPTDRVFIKTNASREQLNPERTSNLVEQNVSSLNSNLVKAIFYKSAGEKDESSLGNTISTVPSAPLNNTNGRKDGLNVTDASGSGDEWDFGFSDLQNEGYSGENEAGPGTGRKNFGYWQTASIPSHPNISNSIAQNGAPLLSYLASSVGPRGKSNSGLVVSDINSNSTTVGKQLSGSYIPSSAPQSQQVDEVQGISNLKIKITTLNGKKADSLKNFPALSYSPSQTTGGQYQGSEIQGDSSNGVTHGKDFLQSNAAMMPFVTHKGGADGDFSGDDESGMYPQQFLPYGYQPRPLNNPAASSAYNQAIPTGQVPQPSVPSNGFPSQQTYGQNPSSINGLKGQMGPFAQRINNYYSPYQMSANGSYAFPMPQAGGSSGFYPPYDDSDEAFGDYFSGDSNSTQPMTMQNYEGMSSAQMQEMNRWNPSQSPYGWDDGASGMYDPQLSMQGGPTMGQNYPQGPGVPAGGPPGMYGYQSRPNQWPAQGYGGYQQTPQSNWSEEQMKGNVNLTGGGTPNYGSYYNPPTGLQDLSEAVQGPPLPGSNLRGAKGINQFPGYVNYLSPPYDNTLHQDEMQALGSGSGDAIMPSTDLMSDGNNALSRMAYQSFPVAFGENEAWKKNSSTEMKTGDLPPPNRKPNEAGITKDPGPPISTVKWSQIENQKEGSGSVPVPTIKPGEIILNKQSEESIGITRNQGSQQYLSNSQYNSQTQNGFLLSNNGYLPEQNIDNNNYEPSNPLANQAFPATTDDGSVAMATDDYNVHPKNIDSISDVEKQTLSNIKFKERYRPMRLAVSQLHGKVKGSSKSKEVDNIAENKTRSKGVSAGQFEDSDMALESEQKVNQHLKRIEGAEGILLGKSNSTGLEAISGDNGMFIVTGKPKEISTESENGAAEVSEASSIKVSRPSIVNNKFNGKTETLVTEQSRKTDNVLTPVQRLDGVHEKLHGLADKVENDKLKLLGIKEKVKDKTFGNAVGKGMLNKPGSEQESALLNSDTVQATNDSLDMMKAWALYSILYERFNHKKLNQPMPDSGKVLEDSLSQSSHPTLNAKQSPTSTGRDKETTSKPSSSLQTRKPVTKTHYLSKTKRLKQNNNKSMPLRRHKTLKLSKHMRNRTEKSYQTIVEKLHNHVKKMLKHLKSKLKSRLKAGKKKKKSFKAPQSIKLSKKIKIHHGKHMQVTTLKRHHSLHESRSTGKPRTVENPFKCPIGITMLGETVRGGMLSGEFKTIGKLDNHEQCVRTCCSAPGCNVALSLGRECLNVHCYNSNLCRFVPAGSILNIAPEVTYARRPLHRRSVDDVAESQSNSQDQEQEETEHDPAESLALLPFFALTV